MTTSPNVQGVRDWDAAPEPWRSIGKSWVARLPALIAGVSSPTPHGIVLFRKRHNLTQRQLAERAGVSHNAVRRAEQNAAGLLTMQKISSYIHAADN